MSDVRTHLSHTIDVDNQGWAMATALDPEEAADRLLRDLPAYPVIVWGADEFMRYMLRKRVRRAD